MQTILVANPKGGSGKTTLATNVAGWLAGKRQRVVLRDLDPQRSATEWLERRPALFPRIAGLARDGEARRRRTPSREWRVVDTPAGLARRRPARRGAPRRRDARAADAVGVRHGGDAALPRRDPRATRRSGRASSRSASSRCASIRARGARPSSTRSSTSFDFPVVAHLRDTQVYVHCARDGASVFDLPRSRGEQDWEQWKPLTRWIARHAAPKG